MLSLCYLNLEYKFQVFLIMVKVVEMMHVRV
jgi:hypothetical protein